MWDYENQLNIARGWRADYIITYGNYWAAGLSYHRTLLGEDISFYKHKDVFQHGGKLVTIATRVILGRTGTVKGQWGQSGRAQSHRRKIREQKRRQGENVKQGVRKGMKETMIKAQMFKVQWRDGERCACQWMSWSKRLGGEWTSVIFFLVHTRKKEQEHCINREWMTKKRDKARVGERC